MSVSQNGWPAIRSGSDPRLTPLGWITGRVLAGPVHAVLDHVARRFDAEVEPITRGHSWGHHYRAISGSASLSNHASGTAVDLNAPKHPLGAAGTFTPAQTATIRAVVAEVNAAGRAGVVRWGGEYARRKDEMHFEIIGTPAQVATAAAALGAGSPPAAPPTTHTGALTADGNLELTLDGVRGPGTVARWQQVMGTDIDGIVSRPASHLIAADQRFLASVVPAEQVAALTGAPELAADGVEGPATIRVRQFWLFHTHGPAVLGRGAEPADLDGEQGPATTRLLQHALNHAHTGEGRY
jgi:hypothetical protein